MGSEGPQAHQFGVQPIYQRQEHLLAVLLVPVKQGGVARQRSETHQQLRRVRHERASRAGLAHLRESTSLFGRAEMHMRAAFLSIPCIIHGYKQLRKLGANFHHGVKTGRDQVCHTMKPAKNTDGMPVPRV